MSSGIPIVGLVRENGDLEFFGDSGTYFHDEILNKYIPPDLYNRTFKIEYIFPSTVRLSAFWDADRLWAVRLGVADIIFGTAVLKPRVVRKVFLWVSSKQIVHSKKHLQEADLHDANLHKEDLHEANLPGANLRHANLRGTNFQNACLREVDFTDAIMHQTDFRNATLLYANLSYNDLRFVDIRGADLSFADLRGSNLSRVDFENVTLTGADLTNAILVEADLTKTKSLIGVEISNANIKNIKITEDQRKEMKS